MLRASNREKGFTIVELMVVGVVVGVLASVAFPAFNRNLRANAVRGKARAVTELFHEMRGHAAASSRSMFLYLEGTVGSPSRLHIARPGTTSACSLGSTTLPGGSGSFWDQNNLYRDRSSSSDTVAVVPALEEQPKDTLSGTRSICACIRPTGMVFTVPCTGGAPTLVASHIEVYVDDATHALASDYVVRVGVNGLAKVYRP